MTDGDAFGNAYCRRPPEGIVERAAGIQWLVMDCDGVLTDGTISTGPDGEDRKVFHVHDGKGLAMLAGADISRAIVSARGSAALSARAAELGIHELRQHVGDKAHELDRIAQAHGIDAAAIAYMGDDIVDLGALSRAGLSVAVADAHPRCIAASHWVTHCRGGRGAVREVCELILAARGELATVFRRHE
jgi:3-deoxy-D-manno-octulosonate 8-phosphate phosphatase (KDO 8-P phosphatase)